MMRHEHWDEIMKARFVVRIEAPEEDADRLRAVCEEIFDEIRRLESLLSRFVEDSDVSRINRLRQGESLVVSPETFRCLSLALDAEKMTEGHFDIAYLSEGREGSESAFSLLTGPSRVRSNLRSLRIDLGGIGKGFALDHVRPILTDYGYSHALLCADSSTMLALDPPLGSEGWEVSLDHPDGERIRSLNRLAISCSGTAVRGEHIFDVRKRRYASEVRIFVSYPTAATADAFSTAVATMDSRSLATFLREDAVIF